MYSECATLENLRVSRTLATIEEMLRSKIGYDLYVFMLMDSTRNRDSSRISSSRHVIFYNIFGKDSKVSLKISSFVNLFNLEIPFKLRGITMKNLEKVKKKKF